MSIDQSSEKFKELKEKFLQMSLDEKRRHYKCSDKYVMLDDIAKVKDQIGLFAKRSVQKSKNLVFRKMPVLSKEEAMLFSEQISVWEGDITKLEVDAIVNAANETLLCWLGGVDGAIHSAAGSLFSNECRALGGCKTGQAKIAGGYNLPSKYVILTVGPIGEKPDLLKSSYQSCFNLMKSNKLTSIAIPCVSTGNHGYPREAAAKIAVEKTLEFLRSDYGKKVERIVFTLFTSTDVLIYQALMLHLFGSLK